MNRKAIRIAVIWIGLVSTIALAGPSYDISLSVDFDQGTFAGTMRVAYTAPDRLSDVIFRLLPNGGGIYGDASLEVSDVKVDGRPVDAELTGGGTTLCIPLSSPLEPGETIVVDLSFDGRGARSSEGGASGYGVLTKGEAAITLAAFYPLLAPRTEEGWVIHPVPGFGDALVADYAAYHVVVTTETGLGVAATGELIDAAVEDGSTTYRFATGGARDFSIAITDGYEMTEERSGDFTVRTWFTPDDSDAGRAARRLAIEAVALYEGVIGDLPIREIELVEVTLHEAAGVESSGLILISSEYAEHPEDPFYDVIVSHEVAHQWFYNTVGNDVIDDPWLDEGLVSYLSHVFLEQTHPGAAGDQLRRWETSYEAASDKYDHLTVASRLFDFPDVSSYTSHVYSGGALLFDAIRSEIGDSAFFTALSDYYRENSGKIATPADLIGAFERASDRSLDRLFAGFTGN